MLIQLFLFIIIHWEDNHPSKEDEEVTKIIKDAGDILGIKVLDHIIIGKENYFSLKNK